VARLNVAELFIFSAAIYAHDWGMAVSESEKRIIASSSSVLPDRRIVREDRARFLRFLRENASPEGEGVDSEIWQRYVRETHGWRSGLRIREYFEQIDPHLGEAVASVAVGHVLPINQLEDYSQYPLDLSVLGFTANTRALTLYLRLIDLLDFGSDRTPYSLWKFVWPLNRLSQLEWGKHRALSPVTFSAFGGSRIACTDGQTDDAEVYAKLEDLRCYCDKEIRECLDLLARDHNPAYHLDLASHLRFRVKSVGFDPILAKFEFHAPAMLEILSTALYADNHVFLRELLLNSIDAIRLRRAVLTVKGIKLDGEIDVVVTKTTDGWRLEWRDNGAGFDEYILKNYFAQVGISYYRSEDFRKLGLTLDPISRFGIGLLTCFRASDRMRITTFRDPLLSRAMQGLDILIESPLHHFRVTRLCEGNAHSPGTRVVLEVGREKIHELNVVEYLKRIAGFVEFPIRITEASSTTVIVHPDQASSFRSTIPSDVQLAAEEPGFPWSDAIVPQDLPTAKEKLEERVFDFSSELNLPGTEGWLAYLTPKEPADLRDFSSLTRWSVQPSPEELNRCSEVRFREEWVGQGQQKTKNQPGFFRVHQSGILLSGADHPGYASPWLVPSIRVNFTRAPRAVNLSRTEFLAGQESRRWEDEIWSSVARRLIEEHQSRLLAAEPGERWYRLGRLLAFNPIPRNFWPELLPAGRWPVLVTRDETLDAIETRDLKDELELMPRALLPLLSKPLLAFLFTQSHERLPLGWEEGGVHLIPESTPHGKTAAMRMAELAVDTALTCEFEEFIVQFLESPISDLPIPQIVLRRYDKAAVLTMDLLDRALLQPEQVSIQEARALFGTVGFFPEALPFAPPYEHCFSYGLSLINLNHPTSRALLRVFAGLEALKIRKATDPAQLGILADGIERGFPGGDGVNYSTFKSHLTSLLTDAKQLQLLNCDIETLVPTRSEIISQWSGDTFVNTMELDRRLSRALQEVAEGGRLISMKRAN